VPSGSTTRLNAGEVKAEGKFLEEEHQSKQALSATQIRNHEVLETNRKAKVGHRPVCGAKGIATFLKFPQFPLFPIFPTLPKRFKILIHPEKP
jgi:hypothetical protein